MQFSVLRTGHHVLMWDKSVWVLPSLLTIKQKDVRGALCPTNSSAHKTWGFNTVLELHSLSLSPSVFIHKHVFFSAFHSISTQRLNFFLKNSPQMCPHTKTHSQTRQQTELCPFYLRWTPKLGVTALSRLNGSHCHADWHLPLGLISMDQRSLKPQSAKLLSLLMLLFFLLLSFKLAPRIRGPVGALVYLISGVMRYFQNYQELPVYYATFMFSYSHYTVTHTARSRREGPGGAQNCFNALL